MFLSVADQGAPKTPKSPPKSKRPKDVDLDRVHHEREEMVKRIFD